MPVDLHHVTVFVADMDRSLHLFRDILGFDLIWRKEKVGGHQLSALVGIPEFEVELLFLQRQAGNGVGIELARMILPAMEKNSAKLADMANVGLCLGVEDLDGIHTRLTNEGWTPFTPCMDFATPDGDSVRGFCFRTDEGMNVELIEHRFSQ